MRSRIESTMGSCAMSSGAKQATSVDWSLMASVPLTMVAWKQMENSWRASPGKRLANPSRTSSLEGARAEVTRRRLFTTTPRVNPGLSSGRSWLHFQGLSSR